MSGPGESGETNMSSEFNQEWKREPLLPKGPARAQIFERQGGGPSRPDYESPHPQDSYLWIQDQLERLDIPQQEREDLNQQKVRLAEEFNARTQFIPNVRAAVNARVRSSSWDEVYFDLQDLAANLEHQATNQRGWDDKYEGLVDDMVKGAAARIALAGMDRRTEEMETSGASTEQIDAWLRDHMYDAEQIQTLGREAELKYIPRYELVPPNLEAVGYEIRKREERLRPAGQPVVQQAEQQPNVLEMVRGLADAIQSGQAKEPEYRQAMGLMSMELVMNPIQLPNWLKDRPEKERREWISMTKMISAAAVKANTSSTEYLFPRDEHAHIIKLTKEDLDRITNQKPGALEAVSLMTYIIDEDLDISFLGEYLNNPAESRLQQSVYDIDDETELDQFKEGIAGWLVANGIVPIPNNPNLSSGDKRREQFAEAKESADVMWAQVYMSNFFEDRDSRFNDKRKDKGRASPLGGLKSMATWMAMHPQERLEAKTKKREAWGMFGDWNVNNAQRRLLPVDPKSESAQVLPRRLFRNAFEQIKDGSGKTLLKIYTENGKKLLENPRRRDITKPDFGPDADGTPFGGYYFDDISAATNIFGILNTRNPRKPEKGWGDLGNAFTKLNVEKKYRENILKGIAGLNPKARGLEISGNSMYWSGFVSQVKNEDPNFFR